MNTKVPRVEYSDTILEAVRVMADNDATGVAVFKGDKVVGVLTERSLLRRFIPRNTKPNQVRVSEVMIPMMRIHRDADVKEAARKIIETGRTRVGVFDGNKFLGWVTITDVARAASRRNLLDVLLRRDKPEAAEIVCPKCKVGVLESRRETGGEIVWRCDNCSYYE